MVSFRKKKSSKNVDTAPAKDESTAAPAPADASATPAEPTSSPAPAAPEKPVEEAREPEVSLCPDECVVVPLSVVGSR